MAVTRTYRLTEATARREIVHALPRGSSRDTAARQTLAAVNSGTFNFPANTSAKAIATTITDGDDTAPVRCRA
jgi:hypothetical protein